MRPQGPPRSRCAAHRRTAAQRSRAPRDLCAIHADTGSAPQVALRDLDGASTGGTPAARAERMPRSLTRSRCRLEAALICDEVPTGTNLVTVWLRMDVSDHGSQDH